MSAVMDWSNLKQRFVYFWRLHWKKGLAIVFSVLAWVSLLVSMGLEIADFYEYGTMSSASFGWIWNLVFAAIVYSLILIGNIQGTSLAFNGMLIFVFSSVFNFVLYLAQAGITWLMGLILGDPLTAAISVIYLVATVMSIVSGILVYVYTRRYLVSNFASYSTLRNWTIVFCVLNVISLALFPTVLLLETGFTARGFLAYVSVLGDAFISVAIFFTVSRLKSEY